MTYSSEFAEKLKSTKEKKVLKSIISFYAGGGIYVRQLAHDCDSTRGSSGSSLMCCKLK